MGVAGLWQYLHGIGLYQTCRTMPCPSLQAVITSREFVYGVVDVTLWLCSVSAAGGLDELLLQPALQRQVRLHPAAPACQHLPAPAQRHQCMRHCPAATPTLQASITQLPQPALQGQLWLHLPATARNCAAPLMQAALPHYH
jgi:hypothetical protein